MPHHSPRKFKKYSSVTEGGVVEIVLPLRVSTRGNEQGSMKWIRIAQTTKERDAAYVAIRALRTRPPLPVKVTLTRYAPNFLDEFGNLPSSFKATVDGIAEAYGADDKRMDLYGWNCKQVKSPEYGVGIRIESAGGVA